MRGKGISIRILAFGTVKRVDGLTLCSSSINCFSSFSAVFINVTLVASLSKNDESTPNVIDMVLYVEAI